MDCLRGVGSALLFVVHRVVVSGFCIIYVVVLLTNITLLRLGFSKNCFYLTKDIRLSRLKYLRRRRVTNTFDYYLI